MIVTFPHMGTLYIVLETILTAFGLKVMVPPPVTKRTLALGAAYAPETACLPFKINLGNFIEALERGADTIVTCGGIGPCRLGYYAEIQKQILLESGYKCALITVEPDLVNVWRLIRLLAKGKSWREIYGAFCLAWAKLSTLDEIERQTCRLRPRETQRDSADCLQRESIAAVGRAEDRAAVIKARNDFQLKAGKIAIDRQSEPLRIGLVGEIFLMLESFANQNLIRRLGRMGVEVCHSMLLGDYVKTHIIRSRCALEKEQGVIALAAPYLGHYVGGHGVKSIGCAVEMGHAGYDGLIHVFPFTCMPEVIAKNILPQASAANDIPTMSLAFDEHTGAEGVETRLEAFVDLLRYRRARFAGK